MSKSYSVRVNRTFAAIEYRTVTITVPDDATQEEIESVAEQFAEEDGEWCDMEYLNDWANEPNVETESIRPIETVEAKADAVFVRNAAGDLVDQAEVV